MTSLRSFASGAHHFTFNNFIIFGISLEPTSPLMFANTTRINVTELDFLDENSERVFSEMIRDELLYAICVNRIFDTTNYS